MGHRLVLLVDVKSRDPIVLLGCDENAGLPPMLEQNGSNERKAVTEKRNELNVFFSKGRNWISRRHEILHYEMAC